MDGGRLVSRLYRYASSSWNLVVQGVYGSNISAAGRLPPVAHFVVASYQGGTVYFDATSSTGGDGTITAFHWNYGDGTQANDDATVQYTYAATGTYTVTLTVTSSLTLSGTYSMSVSPTVGA